MHQIKDLKTSGYYLFSQIPDGNTGTAPDLQQVDMILRKPGIYYVNGVDGNDNNLGTCPDQAFKTLEHAYEQLAADAANSEIGTRGGLIYIVDCVTLPDGLTISQNGEASVLSIGGTAYDTKGDVTIRRYSKPDTKDTGYTALSNQKNMFAVAQDTTVSMQGITIDGHSQKLESGDKYLAAEGVTNADAVFEVSGTLNLGSATATHDTLVQNNDASDNNGGLIRVTKGGILNVSGDAPKAADLAEGQAAVYGTRLSGGKADKGSAIYAGQGTSGAVTLAKGTSDYPKVDGSIYLTGEGQEDNNSSYLTIAGGTPGAITDSRYALELEDAYNGRLVVSYPVGTTLSAADGKGYAVSGRQGYDVTVNDEEKSQIILKSLQAVYIDGVDGTDANDGNTPKTAVKTLKRAYDLLKTQKGGMLYVVNTVTITNAQKLTEKSYTNYGTNVDLNEGTVQIQRYGKPTAYGTADWPNDDLLEDNFNVESNVNALFCVSGNGTLDLQNILIDGHKDAVALTDALSYKVNAGAIKATAPLIQVAGGRLNLGEGAVLQNNNNVTAPEGVNIEAGKLQGGAVYNTGTVNVTGGTVKGNSWTGTEKTYQISTGGASEPVKVTPNASGIWQAGTMTVNVNDASAIDWADNQYIYLDEQAYNSSVTEQEAKDEKVSFLNVQSPLPADVVLPLDLNREGTDGTNAIGWFAPGRKVVQMNTAGIVTASNFAVNGDSYAGSWLDQKVKVTEKLALAARVGTETILELQRTSSDCIVDVIVPVKASAGKNTIHNLSGKAIKVSGAVDDKDILAKTKSEVTVKDTLSDTNRIKIFCSDGKIR